MFRRLDDKVRELCAWALASQDPVELHEIATQLRAALREHIKRVRLSAVNAPLTERRGNPPATGIQAVGLRPISSDASTLSGPNYPKTP
jgi:hypothetical protein